MNFFQQKNILSHVKIGFEFEFFSDLHRDKIAEELGKAIGKYIVVPYVVTSQKRKTIYSHSNFNPKGDVFKLEVDGSGGKSMVELVTSPMDWNEAMLTVLQILSWIDENGYTTRWSGIHFSISFSKDLKLPYTIGQISPVKFTLGFDESFIYKRFPEREGSIFARSISNFLVQNPFVIDSNLEGYSNYIYATTKYYGVNFSKLRQNYIEFRYLGGKDYQKKYEEIVECAEFCALYTYNVLKDPQLTDNEIKKLQLIQKTAQDQAIAIRSYEDFKLHFPNINISIDLQINDQLINLYWPQLVPVLFELVHMNSFKEGDINYDAEMMKFQLRGATLHAPFGVSNLELVNCTLSGVYNNCHLWGCNGQNLSFESCVFWHDNTFKSGKVHFSDFETDNNTFVEFWIENSSKLIRGNFERCIKSARVMKSQDGKDAQKLQLGIKQNLA